MKSIKNKYLFFFLRIIRDITNPTKYEIGENLHSSELLEYYFNFNEKAVENQKGGQKSIVYNPNGIPVNPTYIDVVDRSFVYFPITIGQVGLAVFHTYLKSKNDSDKQRFFKFVNWFVENAQVDKKLGARWMTDVALPQYRNPGPWQSAFAQSRAISILLRGYQITDDPHLAELAEQALIPFTVPVKDGGIISHTKWGPFYEEYTAEVPTLVLNGMVFSLCGLYDYVRVFPDNKLAVQLYNDGISTLENCIEMFDIGYWSKYNLCPADWYPKIDPATITYQHLHIIQCEFLYKLTGKEIFHEYAEIFSRQITVLNILKMYVKKYSALKKMKRV